MPSIAACGWRRALVRALPLLTIAAAGCTVAQEPFPNLTTPARIGHPWARTC